jgi:hypothetical protein
MAPWISISYVSKDFNDPTGVVKRSSFIQASDTFYSMEIDYGPTDQQALNGKKEKGSLWPELPDSRT